MQHMRIFQCQFHVWVCKNWGRHEDLPFFNTQAKSDAATLMGCRPEGV